MLCWFPILIGLDCKRTFIVTQLLSMVEIFTSKDSTEAKMIVNLLTPMIEGNQLMDGVKEKFSVWLCICWDNYFSNDSVFDYTNRNVLVQYK